MLLVRFPLRKFNPSFYSPSANRKCRKTFLSQENFQLSLTSEPSMGYVQTRKEKEREVRVIKIYTGNNESNFLDN
jgi:hypothetical protein